MSILPPNYQEIDTCLDDCHCVAILHSEDAHVLVDRGSDTIEPLLQISNPGFIVDGAGESGLGIFARRTFATGDLIWIERPLVIVPEEMIDNVWKSIECRLKPESAKTIIGLRNAHPLGTDSLEGSLRTNFIGIDISTCTTTVSYRGLFPIISRANHSCCSNATYHFDPSTMALELRAARPVESEEEIHIQYIDVLQPKRVRRKLLRELYFFECGCPPCALLDGSPAQSESDTRRSRIGTWFDNHHTFQAWLSDLKIPTQVLLDDSEDLLALIHAEGLEVMQRFALDMICAVFVALGDEDGFKSWSGRARAAARMGGDKHPMVAYYNSTTLNPMSSPLWNARNDNANPTQPASNLNITSLEDK